ncbi:glycosyl transferase family 39 [Desulfarculus baarsii DSM 2075]|uniref:Glycosyl transferase family 39 n=1 Tax=Desulfarculus baarsii (strain ATCC 33931 / DSM 2075 / LMG 7858 / VKM B-1802 / 2st14) TaxID=644282 RepID=E1QIE6_DESB2|nr:glycosyltransferase family 39 protein [Desulfarculus baarsii]ADK85463.1 glycosyl transferase family 39 [Desulfarculus baarsii DSM 2075]
MSPRVKDQRPPWAEAVYWLTLAALCGALFFGALGARTLWETDEARYAEIGREMLDAPSWQWWVVPRLNYVKYMEKPPLPYWLIALSFKAFGVSDYSARLVPAVFGALSVLLTCLLGRWLWSMRAGFFAGLVLCTGLMFALLSQVLLVDMVLCFGVVLSLLGLWAMLQERWWGLYAFWLGCAFGFLTKGLLGPGLAGLAALIFLGLCGQWRKMLGLFDYRGVLLFAALCAPWLIAATVLEDGFIKYFFWDEQFGRLTTTVHQRHEPFWYYFALLPAAFFPWTMLWPAVVARLWPGRAWRAPQNRALLFCLVWFGSYFVFLTLSQSKMLHYALPMLPPLALLTGRALAGMAEDGWALPAGRAVRWGLDALAGLMLLCAAAVPLAPQFAPEASYERLGLAVFAVPLALAAAAFGVHLTRGKTWAAVAVPLAVFAMMAGGYLVASPLIDDYRSLAGLVRPIRDKLSPDDVLASYGDYYHGAVFYGRRRVMIVGNWGELDYGRQRDPQADKWFLAEGHRHEAVVKLARSPRRVFLLGETEKFQRLLDAKALDQAGVKLHQWARLGDKSLYVNRPRP